MKVSGPIISSLLRRQSLKRVRLDLSGPEAPGTKPALSKHTHDGQGGQGAYETVDPDALAKPALQSRVIWLKAPIAKRQPKGRAILAVTVEVGRPALGLWIMDELVALRVGLENAFDFDRLTFEIGEVLKCFVD